jgi:hypothetical protein
VWSRDSAWRLELSAGSVLDGPAALVERGLTDDSSCLYIKQGRIYSGAK